MPTTFVTTTFVVLVGLNNYGGLAPVDKSLLPPGTPGAILWSVDQCNMVRGKMVDPQKYTCQMFTSAKETAWTYTPEGATGVVALLLLRRRICSRTPAQSTGLTKPEPAKEIESKNDVQVGGLENAPARVVMHKITNGSLPKPNP